MQIELNDVIEKYLAVSGGYGKSVELADLGFSREDIETILGAYDEDYQISRFFHFACAAGSPYQINGFPQTHVSIDPDVQSVL
jgi:hypothetical protein